MHRRICLRCVWVDVQLTHTDIVIGEALTVSASATRENLNNRDVKIGERFE